MGIHFMVRCKNQIIFWIYLFSRLSMLTATCFSWLYPFHCLLQFLEMPLLRLLEISHECWFNSLIIIFLFFLFIFWTFSKILFSIIIFLCIRHLDLWFFLRYWRYLLRFRSWLSSILRTFVILWIWLLFLRMLFE